MIKKLIILSLTFLLLSCSSEEETDVVNSEKEKSNQSEDQLTYGDKDIQEATLGGVVTFETVNSPEEPEEESEEEPEEEFEKESEKESDEESEKSLEEDESYIYVIALNNKDVFLHIDKEKISMNERYDDHECVKVSSRHTPLLIERSRNSYVHHLPSGNILISSSSEINDQWKKQNFKDHWACKKNHRTIE